jgi:hypothetical protein
LRKALRPQGRQPDPGRTGEQVGLHRTRILLRGSGAEHAEVQGVSRRSHRLRERRGDRGSEEKQEEPSHDAARLSGAGADIRVVYLFG